jgi:hypothetical protein
LPKTRFAKFVLKLRKIKFPAKMAIQEKERLYFKAKLFQSKDYTISIMGSGKKENVFVMSSPHILIRGAENGEITFTKENTPTFYFSKLTESLGEMFAVGIEIRANNSPILQATENLLLNEELNSADLFQKFEYKTTDIPHSLLLSDFNGDFIEMMFDIEELPDDSRIPVSHSYG